MGSGVYLWGKPDSNATTFYVTAAADAVLGGGGGGSSGGDASAANQVTGNNTLASILAKQPALGTAGTASTDVITVQGIASGTNINVNCASGCSGGGSSGDTTASGTITVADGSPTSGTAAGSSVVVSNLASSNVVTAFVTDGSANGYQFYGSNDSSVWYPLNYFYLDNTIAQSQPVYKNGVLNNSYANVSSSPALFLASSNGYLYVKFTRTDVDDDSGSATVVLRSSAAGTVDQYFAANTAGGRKTLATILASVDAKLPTLVSSRIPVDGSGVTQPISNSSLSSIDTKTPSLGLAATSASSPVSLSKDVLTDLSGTITTGGTSQTLRSATAADKSIEIYNNDSTEPLCFKYGTTASTTAAGNYCIIALGYYSNTISNQRIDIIATTTGHKFTATVRQ